MPVKVTLRPTVSRPIIPSVKPHLWPKTRFLLLSDICGFPSLMNQAYIFPLNNFLLFTALAPHSDSLMNQRFSKQQNSD
jgi:hypothetical protein